MRDMSRSRPGCGTASSSDMREASRWRILLGVMIWLKLEWLSRSELVLSRDMICGER